MKKLMLLFVMVLLTLSFVSAFDFIRGDANYDGRVDLSDALYISNYLFLGGEAPRCEDAADVNDDGFLDLSDAQYLANYLFKGTNGPPPAPFPLAGEDSTADNLDCGDAEEIIELASCGVIDKPGHYVLMNDVSAEHTCFEIRASNVILDGDGKTLIFGLSNAPYLDGYVINEQSYGVILERVADVLIENFVIQEGNSDATNNRGIYLLDSSDITVRNNIIQTSGEYVSMVRLHNVRNSNFISNTLINIRADHSEGQTGFFLDYDSVSNIFRDNLINMLPSNSIGFMVASDSNIIEANSIVVEGEDSTGILVLEDDNRFSENTIESFGFRSAGVILALDASNNFFEDIYIATLGLESSAVKQSTTSQTINFFQDSIFHAVDFSYETLFHSTSFGSLDYRNVNLANGNLLFESDPISKLNMNWYFDGFVRGQKEIIANANVVVFNEDGGIVFKEITNSEGRINRQILLSSIQDRNGIDHKVYRIEVSHPDYKTVVREIGGDVNPIEGNLDLEFVMERRK